jgi:glutathione synthase/RimK-type ligase-like ATP-grasp enzyme
MKKIVIGLIFDNKIGYEEKRFLKAAKKLNIELVLFNMIDEIREEEIEEKAKKCDIIYDDCGDPITTELVKSLEILGKKVLEKGKIAYYTEDKWIFYLKCLKHKIPAPETILLPINLDSAKKELIRFAHWPVILKRVYGTWGEFVEKADNVNEAMKIIKDFWKKGKDRLPIIAQEYVISDSYRVTIIDNKIVQTSLKKRHGWKATGVYKNTLRKFKVNKELKKVVDKLIKINDIGICGLDFVKKSGKWLVIEANAEPGFDAVKRERNKLIEKVLIYLKNKAKKN